VVDDQITFSFGKNWSEFVQDVTENDVSRAIADINYWLGEGAVANQRVLDIGSGSGIHSLSFWKLRAATVYSFDYDEFSVKATRKLHESAGCPANWSVEQGSILDSDYVRSLGNFDIVYSWGVLHHTGSMWEAVDNAFGLVAPGGKVWISLYAKGDRYEDDLKLKRQFNSASTMGKQMLVARRVLRIMLSRIRHGKNPFAWNEKLPRGMNVYHDIIDWLGGLPYETASEDEVVRFARRRNFTLERIMVAPEGGCSVYVFSSANRS